MRTYKAAFFIATFIAALTSAHLVSADTTNLCLVTPGSSWSLEIDVPGYKVQKEVLSPDGTSAQLMAVNERNDIILSAFLEKAAGPVDAKACRQYYWSKTQENPITRENITLTETGSVALVEYLDKDLDGVPVNQQNLNAYLATNDYWIDVHISKTDFKPGDEAMFHYIVKNIRINGDFTSTPLVYAAWDSFFMAQHNFDMAGRLAQKALEIDRLKPQLTHRQKIFVLEDVVNAYGNMGNNEKAKEFSELGLKQEPGYPEFYYDIACSFAETGDKTNALANLKLAFQNKAKSFPGDQISDPRTDSSFANYANDPDFVIFYAGLDRAAIAPAK